MILKKTIAIVMLALVITACNTEKAKEYNIDLNDGTSVVYNSKDEAAISIKGWSEFNQINNTLNDLEEVDYVIPMERLESLNSAIINLANSVPSSLKTEEVLEDIADIQEEFTKLINEKYEPLDNVKQNIEELVEKFYDLREELNEIVEAYITK